MFRLILLIYEGENTKKCLSKFMDDNLNNSMILNLTENS